MLVSVHVQHICILAAVCVVQCPAKHPPGAAAPDQPHHHTSQGLTAGRLVATCQAVLLPRSALTHNPDQSGTVILAPTAHVGCKHEYQTRHTTSHMSAAGAAAPPRTTNSRSPASRTCLSAALLHSLATASLQPLTRSPAAVNATAHTQPGWASTCRQLPAASHSRTVLSSLPAGGWGWVGGWVVGAQGGGQHKDSVNQSVNYTPFQQGDFVRGKPPSKAAWVPEVPPPSAPKRTPQRRARRTVPQLQLPALRCIR